MDPAVRVLLVLHPKVAVADTAHQIMLGGGRVPCAVSGKQLDGCPGGPAVAERVGGVQCIDHNAAVVVSGDGRLLQNAALVGCYTIVSYRSTSLDGPPS